VAAQEQKPQSILNFYRALAKLRATHPVFVYGSYELLLPDHPQIYAYERRFEETRAIVVCNMSGREASCDLSGSLLLGNYQGEAKRLWPYEARVLSVSGG
jgi:alpha-glucosidase